MRKVFLNNSFRKTLFVVSKSRKWSKKNQEMYNIIEFIDPDTGMLYKTYVSDNNFNFKNWEDLMEIMDLHPDQAIVIEGVFKPSKRTTPDVINADSKFKPIANFDRDVLMNEVWHRFYA